MKCSCGKDLRKTQFLFSRIGETFYHCRRCRHLYSFNGELVLEIDNYIEDSKQVHPLTVGFDFFSKGKNVTEPIHCVDCKRILIEYKANKIVEKEFKCHCGKRYDFTRFGDEGFYK